MPKFEVIGGVKDDQTRNRLRAVRKNLNLRLIEGGKKGKAPEIHVIAESKINEERTFTKEEILSLIFRIAKAEGFKKEHLEISQEEYDTNKNLVGLAAEVVPGRARGEGWGRIEFLYMIKGYHGKAGFSAETSIARVRYPISDPENVTSAGIVAKYQNGSWTIQPGHEAPNAFDITIDPDSTK